MIPGERPPSGYVRVTIASEDDKPVWVSEPGNIVRRGTGAERAAVKAARALPKTLRVVTKPTEDR